MRLIGLQIAFEVDTRHNAEVFLRDCSKNPMKEAYQ